MAVKIWWRTSDKLYGNGYSGPYGANSQYWIMYNGKGYAYSSHTSGIPNGTDIPVNTIPGNQNLSAAAWESAGYPPKVTLARYYSGTDQIGILLTYYNSYGSPIGNWGNIFTYPSSVAVLSDQPTEPYASQGLEAYQTIPEGFLDITGTEVSVYCPHIGAVLGTLPKAHAGDTINLTIHTKNTGADDNFKVELIGDETFSSEFFLGANGAAFDMLSFTMLNKNMSITINTYHWEEGVGWVWDNSSVWELLFPFMNIKDRPYKQ